MANIWMLWHISGTAPVLLIPDPAASCWCHLEFHSSTKRTLDPKHQKTLLQQPLCKVFAQRISLPKPARSQSSAQWARLRGQNCSELQALEPQSRNGQQKPASAFTKLITNKVGKHLKAQSSILFWSKPLDCPYKLKNIDLSVSLYHPWRQSMKISGYWGSPTIWDTICLLISPTFRYK